MPAKFRVKEYQPGGMYHIYNRGVEGKDVFRDENDFQMYLKLLKKYLEPFTPVVDVRFKGERPYLVKRRQEMNLSSQIKVWAYCLMPDHFHLLLKQEGISAMTKLMRRVGTNYVMYFNKKYKRRGALFENAYRAVRIDNMEKVVYLTRLIHLNPGVKEVRRFGPVATVTGSNPEEYLYSSLSQYLKGVSESWLEVREVLAAVESLGKWKNYREFVQDSRVETARVLGEVMLDV